MRLFKRRPLPRAAMVQVLRAEPGDIVVISTPASLPREECKAIFDGLSEWLPAGVRIAVMQEGLHVQSVIRPVRQTPAFAPFAAIP